MGSSPLSSHTTGNQRIQCLDSCSFNSSFELVGGVCTSSSSNQQQQNPEGTAAATIMSSSSSRRNRMRIAIGLFVYILTGILQPIVIDYLRLHQLLGRKLILLPTLANTSGMALCGLLVKRTHWDAFRSLLFNTNNNNNNNSPNQQHSRRLKKMILVTALVDLLSGMFLTFGILLTGGAIFVILYNSCPAWTALLSRFILNRKLNVYQMGGVLVVCVGLCMNILGSRAQAQAQAQHDGENNKEGENVVVGSVSGDDRGQFGVMAGCAFVLIGSFLHSLMFVLSDLSMNMKMNSSCDPHNQSEEVVPLVNANMNVNVNVNEGDRFILHGDDQRNIYADMKNAHAELKKDKKNNPPPIHVVSGEIWSCCLGSIETCFMVVWVIFGIWMYGFDDNEADADVDADNDESSYAFSALMGFLALIIVDAIHAATFFSLLQNIGAVASALMKGVQAVVVVGLAAVLYCPSDEAECLTWMKSISALVVVSGVLGYGFGSKLK